MLDDRELGTTCTDQFPAQSQGLVTNKNFQDYVSSELISCKEEVNVFEVMYL